MSDRFKTAENEVKGTINGYVEDIKTNFAHELKQKLIVHKRNMIEAVETKCFELDKELDHIKQALQGAQIVVESSPGPRRIPENSSMDEEDFSQRKNSPDQDRERRKTSPSPDGNNQTLSSPLKALDISPEMLRLANGRYSKIMKLALVKSIDKYKQIRDRLEAVERQVNLMLNKAYTGAKDELNKVLTATGAPVEQKKVKSLVVGVKRILEEKVIANENIKSHDMKLQRIDADGKLVPSNAISSEE